MAQTPNPRKRHDPMINNIIHLNSKCQEKKFKVYSDPLHATKEMCNDYCKKILKIEDSPWGTKSNPVRYFVKNGNTKLSLNQRKIIHFLHREYFSRGKACWLKRRNIIKQADFVKMHKSNLTRTINKLVDRGILLKITGESKKQKVVFIMPNIYSYYEINDSIRDSNDVEKETDTGGGISLLCKYI